MEDAVDNGMHGAANNNNGGNRQGQQQNGDGIKVQIGHANHPLEILTNIQMRMLIVQIREQWNNAVAQGIEHVNFDRLQPILQSGVVEIRFADERSFNWFREIAGIIEIGVPIRGRVINNALERRVKYTIKMIAEEIGTRTLLNVIRLGNQGILVNEWKILHMKEMQDGFHMLVTVSLSLAAADQLENRFRRRIRLGITGLVEMRRLGIPDQAGQDRIIGFNLI